jgi:hypothetical protein
MRPEDVAVSVSVSATNTAPGLACLQKCLAEKDRCIAYQKANGNQKNHNNHKNKNKNKGD